MNPSAYPSVHILDDIPSYTSADDTSSLYANYSSGLYQDLAPSAEVSFGQYAGLGSQSDADQALFEEFLTAEVASINPSDSCTIIPMQSPPSDSCDSASNPLHYLEPLSGCELYPYTTSSLQSNLSSSFEQVFPELVAARVSPGPAIYPSLQSVCDLQGRSSATATSGSPHPYPSPSPEPSPQVQGISPHIGRSHPSLAFGHHPSESTVACISPDLIYPSAHGGYDLDHSTAVGGLSSRSGRRASPRGSPPAPYPTPSPEPLPPASSTVFASQRRNAPARTAAPVPSSTWQCPHCPYIQRNRRSPDLKRHIKTHTRDAEVADWVCCGVPVLDAIELGVPAKIVQERRVFNFDGVLMVGGCRKAFSRRDALKRHLQREEGKCFGDEWSLHQRGNREIC